MLDLDLQDSHGTHTLQSRETGLTTDLAPHDTSEEENQAPQVASSPHGVLGTTDKGKRGKRSLRGTPTADFVPRRSKRISLETTEDEGVRLPPLRRTLSRIYSSLKNAVVSNGVDVSAGNGNVQELVPGKNDDQENVGARTPISTVASVRKSDKKGNLWQWLTTTPSDDLVSNERLQIAHFFASAIPTPPGEPGAFAERATQLCLNATCALSGKPRTLDESDETSMWEWLGDIVNVKNEGTITKDVQVENGPTLPLDKDRDTPSVTRAASLDGDTPSVTKAASLVGDTPSITRAASLVEETPSVTKETSLAGDTPVVTSPAGDIAPKLNRDGLTYTSFFQSLKASTRPSVAVIQHAGSVISAAMETPKTSVVKTGKRRASTSSRLSAKVKFTLPRPKETSGDNTNTCKKRRLSEPAIVSATSPADAGKDAANPEDDDDESWNIADSEDNFVQERPDCREIPTSLIDVAPTAHEPVKAATVRSIKPKDKGNKKQKNKFIPPAIEQDVTENPKINDVVHGNRPFIDKDSYDASLLAISNLDDPIAALAHAVALVASQEELYPTQATLRTTSISTSTTFLKPAAKVISTTGRFSTKTTPIVPKVSDNALMPPPPVPSPKILSGKENANATNLLNHQSQGGTEKDLNQWEPPIEHMDCAEPCNVDVSALEEQSVALAEAMALVARQMESSFGADSKWTTPARNDENKKTTSTSNPKKLSLRRKQPNPAIGAKKDVSNGSVEGGMSDLAASPLITPGRSKTQFQTPAMPSASKPCREKPSEEHRIATRSSDAGKGSASKVSATASESTPTANGKKGRSHSMELLPSSGKATGKNVARSGSANRGSASTAAVQPRLTTSFSPSPSPATKDDLAPSASKKSYIRSGLYSTDLKSQSSNTPSRRKSQGVKNGKTRLPLLPLPIEYGTLLLSEEKDFCLPWDIANDWARGLLIPPEPAYEPYQIIRSNIFVERKPRKSPEVAVCHCVPPEDGGPACAEDCINRMVYYECIEQHCPCGSQCTNRRLQRRERVLALDVFWTHERGHGLRTLVPIKKGQLVLEYRGEVISQKECLNRMETRYAGKKNYYFLEYGQGEVLDAGEKGTEARFVNHSCDPNCHIEKWSVQDGEIRVGLFASEEIPGGSELYYDYNFENFPGAAEQQCLCGSVGCRGVIGQRRHDVRENGNKNLNWKKKGKATKRDGTNGESLSLSTLRLTLGERRRKGAQSSWLAKNAGFLREHRPFLLRNVRNVVAKAAMKKAPSRPTTDRTRETGTPSSRWKGTTRNNDVTTQLENVQADLVTCRERRRGLALRRMRPFQEIMNDLSGNVQMDASGQLSSILMGFEKGSIP